MRIFKTSQLVQATITEETWKHKLHLKDIFSMFQSEKITLTAAKKKIAERIKAFIADNELSDTLVSDIESLAKKISTEDNIEKIDDIINNLYSIADKHLILIK